MRVVVAKKRVDLNAVQVITVEYLAVKTQKQEVHHIARYTNVARVTVLMRGAMDCIVAPILAEQVAAQVRPTDIVAITNVGNVILKNWMVSTFAEITNAEPVVVLPKHIVAKYTVLSIFENI